MGRVPVCRSFTISTLSLGSHRLTPLTFQSRRDNGVVQIRNLTFSSDVRLKGVLSSYLSHLLPSPFKGPTIDHKIDVPTESSSPGSEARRPPFHLTTLTSKRFGWYEVNCSENLLERLPRTVTGTPSVEYIKFCFFFSNFFNPETSPAFTFYNHQAVT